MQLSKEVNELFPVTVHRDELAIILIITKMNKQKTIKEVYKRKANNSLHDLQDCIVDCNV